jgi:hypothetical protein
MPFLNDIMNYSLKFFFIKGRFLNLPGTKLVDVYKAVKGPRVDCDVDLLNSIEAANFNLFASFSLDFFRKTVLKRVRPFFARSLKNRSSISSKRRQGFHNSFRGFRRSKHNMKKYRFFRFIKSFKEFKNKKRFSFRKKQTEEEHAE